MAAAADCCARIEVWQKESQDEFCPPEVGVAATLALYSAQSAAVVIAHRFAAVREA